MALTKTSYSLITGAPINVFDYMTAAQIADVSSNTGSLDVTAPCQAAVDDCVAAGGGEVFFPQGVYLLNGVTGADGTVHGILVPFTGLAIEGAAKSVNLTGTGRDCVLKAGTANMLTVRFSNSQSSMQNFAFQGNTENTGLALFAENVNSTVLGQVDQSHNNFTNLFFYQNRDSIVLKTSKSPGSGCYYNSFINIYIVFQLNPLPSGHRGRGILLNNDAGDASPPNRNFFYGITLTRLNVGIQIEIADTNTFVSCAFEDIAQGTLPQPVPTAIVVNNTPFSPFNRFIGCTIEASTRSVFIGNVRTEFFGCEFGTGTQIYPAGNPEYIVGGPPANMGFSTPAIKYNLPGFASLETLVGGTDFSLTRVQGEPVRIQCSGNTVAEFDNTSIDFAESILPTVDNSVSVGNASFRWSVIYSATPTINTSDENQKTEIVDVSDAEKQVAKKLKNSIKRFKFKSAVQLKKDKARKHFGIIAQQVKEAFESENLNAEEYGIFCADELENGEIRYGVRYDELYAFIISSLD